VPSSPVGDAQVAVFVAALLARRGAPVADCPWTPEEYGALGLHREGDQLLPPASWEPLDPGAIRASLGGRAREWLAVLGVHPAIGSTNATLVERAQVERIHGHACLAELQLAGRGRRGRSWLSPLGGNLAVSLGFEAARPAAELGGLSLVVGLAVVDVLERAGVAGLALKWPNDVLLDGAKLGGILIELVATEAANALVIGVGINLQIPEAARRQLDQPVADLASLRGVLPGRSELAGRLISSIVEFEAEFSASGFAPFAAIFDHRHAFQGAAITLVRGDRAVAGHVLGVAPDGGLRIRSDAGDEVVHGGEVSLRARL